MWLVHHARPQTRIEAGFWMPGVQHCEADILDPGHGASGTQNATVGAPQRAIRRAKSALVRRYQTRASQADATLWARAQNVALDRQ